MKCHPMPYFYPMCAFIPREPGVPNDSASVEINSSSKHSATASENDSDEPNSVRTLTIKERRETGNNTLRTYCEYVKGMGAGFFGSSLLCCVTAYAWCVNPAQWGVGALQACNTCVGVFGIDIGI